MKAPLTRRRILAIAAFALAPLLSPNGSVEACGPDFSPDVFVNNSHPDDISAFARGQLGILQSGFDSNHYAAAYRYLIGSSLNIKEQTAIVPFGLTQEQMTPEQWKAKEQEAAEAGNPDEEPSKLWHNARAEFIPDAAAASKAANGSSDRYLDAQGNVVVFGDYYNCPGAAYTNATLTLSKRAVTWGKSSPILLDWIHAQDAVFSHCNGRSGIMPASAPAHAPALLRADRAYQAASAVFYDNQYDAAIQQFTAIANDKDSPWHDWGLYLAARATVRKAFNMGKPTEPYSGDLASFDLATMKQAQQMLESLLAEPHPTPSREAITSELNFVRIRTEPAKRIAEISAALIGPAHDPHFAQNLADLNWILSKGTLNAPDKTSTNYLQIAPANRPPLLNWIAAWRGLIPTSTLISNWQQSHALSWLVVAIAKANAKTNAADIPALLTAAEAVPANSPAYQTVFYHRVRLLLESNRLDEARALLDPALAATQSSKPDSWRNALLAERLSAARNYAEFLTYSPRTALETGSQPSWDLHALCQKRADKKPDDFTPAPCPELDSPLTFDTDATSILNEQTPLLRLIEAAKSPALPVNLRQNVAIIAWTRAVVLDDTKSAAALAHLLPKEAGVTAQTASGFPAVVAILRNDGMQPTLDPGIARVASFNQFDQFRDNGWCSLNMDLKPENGATPPPQPALPQPALFTPEEQQQAATEYARLKALPDSQELLTQRVLAYAKAHPTDPLVPEALHLAVRATHFSCKTYDPKIPWDQRPPYNPTSKAAFQLLHKNYPNSPWAKKTRTYY